MSSPKKPDNAFTSDKRAHCFAKVLHLKVFSLLLKNKTTAVTLIIEYIL